MITKTIEELSILVKTGKTPSTKDKLNFEDGEYNWFTPGDFRTPKVLRDSKRKITDYAAKNNAVIYQPDTILITCIGDIGNTGIIKKKASANQQITGIVVNSDIILPEFFLYWVKANKEQIQDEANQAVVPIINNKGLKRIKVTFPSDLPTQNKIVALLDKASALVQKRDKSITQLDELLRAQFLEMFGDPVLNPKSWKKKEISSYCNIITGNTPPRSKKEYYNEKYIEWLKTDNIKSDKINPTIAKEYLSESGAKKSRIIGVNGLLVACIAGSLSSIGRVSICDREVAFNQQINGIRIKEKYNSYFLYSLITYSKEYIQGFATKGMKRLITKGVFEKIPFIVPPIKLQNEFEPFFKNIQAQKETLIQSKKELENLYNSLLQRAFSGQLNFNVDVELDALLAAINLEQDTDKEKHNIKEIATVYAGRLLERIEEQNFENQIQYQQAKQVVFQMLEEGIVVQTYDENTEAVKMTLV
jgi:type I restriction enzyme S subunit